MGDVFPREVGRYRILSLIGAGGMGEVYLADDAKLGRRVAIKILPEAVSRDTEAKLRMLREARAVAALDHPNVCTIYEVGEHDGRPYIAMQFFLGALAHAFGCAGRAADAERLVEQLRTLARQRYVSPYSFAVAHTGMGQVDEALAALEGSLEEHNAWAWFLPVDPRFDRFRSDERFVSLMTRYGLPATVEAET